MLEHQKLDVLIGPLSKADSEKLYRARADLMGAITQTVHEILDAIGMDEHVDVQTQGWGGGVMLPRTAESRDWRQSAKEHANRARP